MEIDSLESITIGVWSHTFYYSHALSYTQSEGTEHLSSDQMSKLNVIVALIIISHLLEGEQVLHSNGLSQWMQGKHDTQSGTLSLSLSHSLLCPYRVQVKSIKGYGCERIISHLIHSLIGDEQP